VLPADFCSDTPLNGPMMTLPDAEPEPYALGQLWETRDGTQVRLTACSRAFAPRVFTGEIVGRPGVTHTWKRGRYTTAAEHPLDLVRLLEEKALRKASAKSTPTMRAPAEAVPASVGRNWRPLAKELKAELKRLENASGITGEAVRRSLRVREIAYQLAEIAEGDE
jgi:hypothetical protein